MKIRLSIQNAFKLHEENPFFSIPNSTGIFVMSTYDPFDALNNIPDAFKTAIDPSKLGTQEAREAQDVLRKGGLWPDEDKDD
jgi:hypothetical protein